MSSSDENPPGYYKDFSKSSTKLGSEPKGPEQSKSFPQKESHFAGLGSNTKTSEFEPVSFDKDFAKFSKHTKGFGLKILQKYGFKGRLGKKESGRVNPIIPEVRRGKKGKSRGGISYGGTEKKIDRDGNDFQKMAADAEIVADQLRKEQMDFFARINSSGWKKGSKKKKVKSSRDVLKSNKSSGVKTRDRVVYDYTKEADGEKVEINSSIFQKIDDQIFFPELRFNLLKTVESIEVKIFSCDTEKQRVSKARDNIQQRQSKLAAREQIIIDQREKTKKFFSALEELKSHFLEAENTTKGPKFLKTVQNSHLSDSELAEKKRQKSEAKEKLGTILQTCLEKLETLRKDFGQEFDSFDMSSILMNSFLKPLGLFLADWNPILRDKKILALLKKLRYLLYDKYSTGDSESLYANFCNRVVAPKLRQFVLNQWVVIRQNQNLVDLLKEYQEVVSENFFGSFFDSFICPKLGQLIQNWDFKRTDISLVSYIKPWTELLQSHPLDKLHEAIQKNLSHYIDRWSLKDEQFLLTLQSIKTLIPKRVNSLIRSKILPKIATELGQLKVNPMAQNFDLLNFIIRWEFFFTTKDLVFLYEREFFAKWITIIHVWVTSSTNAKSQVLADLEKWYRTWRDCFPEKMFDNQRFLENILTALDLLNCATWGHEIPPVELVLQSLHDRLSRIEPSSEVLRKSKKDQKMFDRKESQGKPIFGNIGENESMEENVSSRKTNANDSEIPKKSKRFWSHRSRSSEYSFSDVVSAFAEEHNIEFFPNPNVFHSGRKIYNFGRHCVYLQSQCVFKKKGDQWLPVSLQALLK